MKCPLQNRLVSFTPEKYGYEMGECLQEECAWWLEENDCCAILTLAQGSTYIHRAVLDLVNKMPHEAEFRR